MMSLDEFLVQQRKTNFAIHLKTSYAETSRVRGCLHDPALPGCNEAWDRFDVLKIAISCGTCLIKIVS